MAEPVFLVNDDTRNDMQFKLDLGQSLREIPGKQKPGHPKALIYFTERYRNCSESMVWVNWAVYYAQVQLVECFGVSCAAVCRAAKQAGTEMTKNVEFKALNLWPLKFHIEVR